MKRFYYTFIIVVMLVPILLQGQSLDVRSQKKKLPDGTFEGKSITLAGSSEIIEDLWTDKMKDMGRYRKKRGHYQVSEAAIGNQVGLDLATIIDVKNDSTVSLWLAVKSNEVDLQDELEDFMVRFGQDYYRNDLAREMQEAEDAANYISRQRQRLINERKNLLIELEEARVEKASLEAALEEVTLEVKVLEQKIENNKADTEQALIDLERMNKILEKRKKDLRKVN